MWSVMFLLICIGLLLETSFALLPNGMCRAESQKCEFSDDNYIGVINGVKSPIECSRNCQSNSDCNTYSYFGSQGFPYINSCLMFKSCSILESCSDCVTEDISCSNPCSAPIEGVVGENLLQVVGDVQNEFDCEHACHDNPECKFYTYSSSQNSHDHRTCFLLTDILEPIRICEDNGCTTGAPNSKCNQVAFCGYITNGYGSFNRGVLVTETSEPTNVSLVSIGYCQPPIVIAIGAGGHSVPFGGGSGFVDHKIMTDLNQGFMEFVAYAGEQSPVHAFKGASVVMTSSDNATFMRAEAGGGSSMGGCSNGAYGVGCPGYSGSGGFGENEWSIGGSGGSNGGDGQDSRDFRGGSGSGIKVNNFVLQTFLLSPGRGGVGKNYYPGGGGGIFVGNEPSFSDCIYGGEGFGGGTGFSCYAKPGAIIFDFCFHEQRCIDN